MHHAAPTQRPNNRENLRGTGVVTYLLSGGRAGANRTGALPA